MTVEPRERPWPKKRLRRVGEALVAGGAWPSDVPTFEDVAGWFDEVKAYVQASIYVMNWEGCLDHGVDPDVTARVKTDDTLREKLVRRPNFPLGNVHDVAGVRVEVDMNLTQQTLVSDRIASHFRALRWNAEVGDQRENPGEGNYRAIHVILERQLDGARVEVQVRTLLQGLWANVYERLADSFGRDIRYGHLPSNPTHRKIVQDWQMVSIDGVKTVEYFEDGAAEIQTRINALPPYKAKDSSYRELVSMSDSYRNRILRYRNNVEAALRRTLDSMDTQATGL